ncbi:MAG: hypothetical protein AAF846_24990 [Chloroflexota bacterium]
MASLNQFLEAQRQFQRELLAKTGVVGVGIGYKNADQGESDELSVVAMVEEKRPIAGIRAQDLVPPQLDGIRTDVIEVGTIRAQNTTSRSRWRPTIPAGVSIGHFQITAGTYGALVYDANGTAYILSNNHVIANSNDALINDAIIQPGATDGGVQGSDTVAVLHRYAKITYSDENVVGDPNPIIGKDVGSPPNPTPTPPTTPPTTPTNPSGDGCAAFIVSFADAIARANDPDARVQIVRGSAQNTTFDPFNPTTIEAQATIAENQLDAGLALPTQAGMFIPEIREIGVPTGTKAVMLGMSVRKQGRTTGLTTGTVTLINATVDVGYRTAIGSRTARFTGQVMTTGMSQGGDSGSVIMDGTSLNAVGLLFAGSGTATIFTPIDRVLQKLGVSITP